jgi:hypothetical protein
LAAEGGVGRRERHRAEEGLEDREGKLRVTFAGDFSKFSDFSRGLPSISASVESRNQTLTPANPAKAAKVEPEQAPNSEQQVTSFEPKPAAGYETLARSGLVARIRAAWPWLAEYRPDLYQAIKDADDTVTALTPEVAGYPEALARLVRALGAADQAWVTRSAVTHVGKLGVEVPSNA